MIKKYVSLLFLLLSCLTINTTLKIEVDYDEQNDIINANGILYYPARGRRQLNIETSDGVSSNSNITSAPSAHHEELASGGAFWFYFFSTLTLTCFAGMMSGLTVGYLSIDDLVLELRSTTGTEEEKLYASKVLPILADRHWLLVTLLLMNAFAMEALPLCLDKIVPEYLAVIIAVTLVLIFGEVLPQAVCTGPDQVKIASMISPVTKFLMLISSPISYPIAKILDRLLGEHHKSRFLNNDLKALIELHTFNALERLNLSHDQEDPSSGSEHKMGINDEQANLMISAIEMREKKVIELMIPIKNVFLIDYDEVLDKFKLQLILDKGYSRIPVYSNHNANDIVGLLRIKNLIGVDFNQNKTLRQLGIELKKPLVISPRFGLLDLLRQFREGHSHMAFITEHVEELQEKFGIINNMPHVKGIIRGNKDTISFKKEKTSQIKILGIITLEDVIEKMINLDILDEDDYDKLSKQKRNSKLNKAYGKEIARSLIKEEGSKLDNIIKESYNSRKKSLKEMFLKKTDSISGSYATSKFLKEPLV